MLFNYNTQNGLPAGQAGVAGLLIIVSIALFVFAISIYLAVQSNTSIFAGQFESQADKAQFLAESGIQ
ncbi:MAG: hypothetical protein AAB772_02080, partial [Patescibacteria group bacterium]